MLNLSRPTNTYLDKAKKIQHEEENWEIEKENLKKRNKIYEEYDELCRTNTNKLSTSKKALIFLFISCSIIEIFTMWVTIQSLTLAFTMGLMPDFTPLVTLIGTVVGEVVGLGAYYIKAAKENTSGGIKYESAAAHGFNYDWNNNAVG